MIDSLYHAVNHYHKKLIMTYSVFTINDNDG